VFAYLNAGLSKVNGKKGRKNIGKREGERRNGRKQREEEH
jgi:hypothetical protein